MTRVASSEKIAKKECSNKVMLKRLKLIYRDHRYLQGEISLYLFLEMF